MVHSFARFCIAESCLLSLAFVLNAQDASPAQRRPEGADHEIQLALGRVNYNRVLEITQRLQQTLRSIRSYQQLIISTTDATKRHSLEQSINDEIGSGVGQIGDLLVLLQESGFDRIVFDHREALVKGFSRRSLPAYDISILRRAGLSEAEIDEFISVFALHGQTILTELNNDGGVGHMRDRLRAGTSEKRGMLYRQVGSYIKILAGGIAAGGDLLLAPAVAAANPPAALIGVPASIGAGFYYIGIGIREIGEDASANK